ncbi:hypothetical protein EIKCOROL_00129 [Eikenella corrodens ATCC 23834]|uniref:Uncharacterized protein n=1 Tax=Eikenella corrodens ATCC 23834 TaxID=546274 RepID=C0DS13_EIKCO|nr:hypothetical protein EIKCOROL_00129 [Eikenella corrodens ATCC 23834]
MQARLKHFCLLRQQALRYCSCCLQLLARQEVKNGFRCHRCRLW